jgi:hypothetical protein
MSNKRKNNVRYVFNPEEPAPKKTFSFFYQIATFPERQKYHLRKYIFDDKYNFVKIDEYRLSAQDCKKFYDMYPLHQYKQYGVSDLNIVSPPSTFDLQTSLSSNLDTKGSSSNLNAMYRSITGRDVNDYAQLYQYNTDNGMFQTDEADNLDNNVITDFSNFN